jgi:hypothetical protein
VSEGEPSRRQLDTHHGAVNSTRKIRQMVSLLVRMPSHQHVPPVKQLTTPSFSQKSAQVSEFLHEVIQWSRGYLEWEQFLQNFAIPIELSKSESTPMINYSQ